MQLVSLVLRLNDERRVRGLVENGTSGEASSRFAHRSFLGRLIHEVDVAYFLQVINERGRLGAHHLLISAAKLQPGVSENVLCTGSLVGILLKYLQQEGLALFTNVIW